MLSTVQELPGAVLGDFARVSCLSDCRSHLCFFSSFFFLKYSLWCNTKTHSSITNPPKKKKNRKEKEEKIEINPPLAVSISLPSRLAFSIFYIEKLGLINYKTSDGRRSYLMCVRLCLFLASSQQQSSGVRCITSFQKSIRADF